MARPQKNGIEYFSLDVVLDEKIELLEAKYGIAGLGIIIRLWQKIYANSYYIEWNEDILLLFKKSVNVDINQLNDIINDCLRWQIFDGELYQKYGILSSAGIQRRYIEATQRRKEVTFISEYLLIENVSEKYQKTVNVVINSNNEDNNSKKENSGTQSKVKESKVNTSTNVDVRDARKTQMEIPTLDEVKAYCKERNSAVDAVRFFDYYQASGWVDRNGNPVRNWKQKVITWEQHEPAKETKSRAYSEEEMDALIDDVESIEI